MIATVLALTLVGELEVGTGRLGDVQLTGVVRINSYGTLDADAPQGATQLSSAAPFLVPPQMVLVYLNREPGASWDGGARVVVSEAGRSQFVRVVSVIGGVATIDRPLDRRFPAADTQLVSVPEYENATLAADTLLDAKPFDTRSGGILALMVRRRLSGHDAGTSRLDVSLQGFGGLPGGVSYSCTSPPSPPPRGDAPVLSGGGQACTDCALQFSAPCGTPGGHSPQYSRAHPSQLLMGPGGGYVIYQSATTNVSVSDGPGGGVVIVRAGSIAGVSVTSDSFTGAAGAVDLRAAGELRCRVASARTDVGGGSGGYVYLEGQSIDCPARVSSGTSGTFAGDVMLVQRNTPTAPPDSLTVAAPREGALLNRPRPLIIGRAAPLARVTAALAGGAALGTADADPDGGFALALTADLPDGPVSLEVNSGSGLVTRSFTIDTVAPPAPTIDTPADGAVLGTPLPGFSGQAADAARVDLSINGALIGSDTPDSQQVWRLALSPEQALAKGTHALVAQASDLAGNTSQTSTTFQVGRTIDDPAPKVSSSCAAAAGLWPLLALLALRARRRR